MSTHVDDHRTACRHHFCCQFHIPDRSTASHHQILPHMSICTAASSNWPMSSHHRADSVNIIFTITVGNYNTCSCRTTDNQFSQLSSVHNQFRGLETLRSASSVAGCPSYTAVHRRWSYLPVLLLLVLGTVCPNMSRPQLPCLFSEVTSRLSSLDVPFRDFHHNIRSACSVTVVIFGHLNRSLFTYLLTWVYGGGGSPTAVQAWQPCLLWEPSPSHPILVKTRGFAGFYCLHVYLLYFCVNCVLYVSTLILLVGSFDL